MPDRPRRSQDSPLLWTIAFSGSIALHAAVWLFDPRVLQVAAPEGDHTDAIAIELIDDPDKPTARSLPQQNRPRSQTNATPSPQPTPTPEPSPAPTPQPTPTPEPTPTPTPTPTPEPSPSTEGERRSPLQPTPEPSPTPQPTPEPTPEPTPAPTPEPLPSPSPQPPDDTGGGSDPDPQPPQPQGVQVSIVGSPRLGQDPTRDVLDSEPAPLPGNIASIPDPSLVADCADRRVTVNVHINDRGQIVANSRACGLTNPDPCGDRVLPALQNWEFSPATQAGGVVSSCLEMDLAIDPL